MEISLFSGIEGLARIGDTESIVRGRSKHMFKSTTVDPEMKGIGFEKILELNEIGVKLYFRHSIIALIEIQDPFQGIIIGKKTRLFPFSIATGEGWEETLIKEFGRPDQHSTGGRFSSQAFYYQWGDVAFNRMGPNQLAIYRDPNVLKFRQKNFGRTLKLFAQ